MNHRVLSKSQTLSVTRTLLAAGLLLGATGTVWAGPTLKTGDPAPPLKITDWVKGPAVNLADGAGKKVYLLEFWATWCTPCLVSMPHLTELQKKHGSDLVVVGITQMDPRNTLSAVRAFVDRQGSRLGYAIGFERDGATSRAYMDAAGAEGIPHAFLIGRDGRIAWQGSPLDPVFDQVVEQVLAGTFDIARSRREQEARPHIQAFMMKVQMRQFAEAADALKRALQADPANEMALSFLESLYREQLQDRAGLRSWYEAHLKKYSDDLDVQALTAETMLHSTDLNWRFPDLAFPAAHEAYRRGAGQHAGAAQAYAFALATVGRLDDAIQVQQEAIPLTNGERHKQAEERLEYYQLCRNLRAEGVPTPPADARQP
ncbi:MAG TPA: TlpA disulfide reductase family protein [Phycisphaerae bacterium]|nr:TlpA disulfide reductase family protein [Phycisphaerae bacterium]HNU43843.1 TlpA disulfide reductase family protein [Phycisphaerae bacterium]